MAQIRIGIPVQGGAQAIAKAATAALGPAALGRRVGLSARAVRKHAAGRRAISAGHLRQYARALAHGLADGASVPGWSL